MDPPWTNRLSGNIEDAEDEPDESSLSHGIREFASALAFGLGGHFDRIGLGKEDEVGLGS